MIVKTVGRSQENNIVITDEKVSRTHLQMVQDDNGNVSVIDLGSTNGTYVNGIRITGETHLKASDEVRIGNTILPWQGYFPPKQASISVDPITPSPTPKPKRNLKWLFIVGGVLLALLIAGGVLLFVNNKKKAEKEHIEQTKGEYEQLINAMDQEVSDEKRGREVAEENARAAEEAKNAAEAKSMAAEQAKNDAVAAKAKAEQAKKEAEQAKKDAEAKAKAAENSKDAAVKKAAADAKKEAEEKADRAEQAQKNAEAKTKSAEQAKNAAEAKVKDAEEKTKAAEQAKKDAEAKTKAAEQAQKDAEKALDLTKDFYEQLNKANRKNKLAAVCKALDISERGNEEAQYERIEKEFYKAKDNATRDDIIKKVKKAI